MRRFSLFLVSLVTLAALVAPSAVAAEEVAGGASYLGASGALTLPQGGSRLRRLGGAAVRGGVYLSDFWAVEGDVAWQENAAGLGVDALVHVQAWSAYGDLFGYSAFDPFVTVGARGWLVSDGGGQVGSQMGVGAFYHLDDSWSLRAEVNMTLGLETRVAAVYTISVGIQRGF